MCDEPYDEIVVVCEDGMRLFVRGNPGHRVCWLGIGRQTSDEREAGDPGELALIAEMDEDAVKTLRKAFTRILI
jgi:hypothetical protein